jgi:hypothetical protein
VKIDRLWYTEFVCDSCVIESDLPFVYRRHRQQDSETTKYLRAMDAVTEMQFRQTREDVINPGQSLKARLKGLGSRP